MKFNPLQGLVAKHYEGGEFSHMTGTDELDGCGDTLFSFAILEAGDADNNQELYLMLEGAINQLRSLQGELL